MPDLSPAERIAFDYLWPRADPEQTGVLIGEEAVKFFEPSKLPPSVLGQIWSISDSDNVGFLTADGFGTALRLIGHAQQGDTVTPALVSRPAPTPIFDGITFPGQQGRAVPPPPPPRSSIAHHAPPPPPTVPPVSAVAPQVNTISAEDKARYARIFANSGPVGGVLDGEKAKGIFIKSQLPVDKLGTIWGLADTHDRGALDLPDFTIAMHYIQGLMNGTISSLPSTLPPSLYEQASGGAPLPLPRTFTPAQQPLPPALSSAYTPTNPITTPSRPPTGFSGTGAPVVAPQYTGQPAANVPPQFTGQGIAAQHTGSAFAPIPPQTTGSQFGGGGEVAWGISPAERAKANQFFDGLDTKKSGLLDGALVVPFFLQSKLDETTLARIWDLADVTQTGTLNRGEFAVAMHLINSRMAGNEVPQTLPASLVPPALRGQEQASGTALVPPPAFSGASAPGDAVLPVGPQQDLLSLLDDDDAPPTLPTQSPFGPTGATGAVAPPGPGSAASVSRQATGASEHPWGNKPAEAVAAPQAWSESAFSPVPAVAPGVAPVPAPERDAAVAASSGLGEAAERGAPNGADTVFLQAAERELAKVHAQRTELDSSLETQTKSVEEMRERIASVQTDIEHEQAAVDELQTKTQAEAAELAQVRAQVDAQKAQVVQLEQEKQELETQLHQGKKEVKDANHQMALAQTASKPVREELERLKASLAPKDVAQSATVSPVEPVPTSAFALSETAPAAPTATTAPSASEAAPASPREISSGPTATNTTGTPQRSTNPFGAQPPATTTVSSAQLSIPGGFDDAFGTPPTTKEDSDPTSHMPGGILSFDDAFGQSSADLSLKDPAASAAAATSLVAQPKAQPEPRHHAFGTTVPHASSTGEQPLDTEQHARTSLDSLEQEYVMPEHPARPGAH